MESLVFDIFKIIWIVFFPGILIIIAIHKKTTLSKIIIDGFSLNLILGIVISFFLRYLFKELPTQIFIGSLIIISLIFLIVSVIKKPKIRVDISFFSLFLFLVFMSLFVISTFWYIKRPLEDYYDDPRIFEKINQPVIKIPYSIWCSDGPLLAGLPYNFQRGEKNLWVKGKCSGYLNLVWFIKGKVGTQFSIVNGNSFSSWKIPVKKFGPHHHYYLKHVKYNYLLLSFRVNPSSHIKVITTNPIQVWDLSYFTPEARKYFITRKVNLSPIIDLIEAKRTAESLRKRYWVYFQPPLGYYLDYFSFLVSPYLSSLYVLFYLELFLIFITLYRIFKTDLIFFIPSIFILGYALFIPGVSYQQDTLYTFFLLVAFLGFIYHRSHRFVSYTGLATLTRFPGFFVTGLVYLGGYQKRKLQWFRKVIFQGTILGIFLLALYGFTIYLEKCDFKQVLKAINYEIIPEHFDKRSITDLESIFNFLWRLVYYSSFTALINLIFSFRIIKNKKAFPFFLSSFIYALILSLTRGKANKYLLPCVYMNIICFYYFMEESVFRKYRRMIFLLLSLTSIFIFIKMMNKFLINNFF